MSDSDQSEESLHSDSDEDLGNTSDVPILSEESEIEDDSRDEVAISSPQYIPTWTKDPPMYGVAEIELSGNSGVSDDVKSSDLLYLFEFIFTEEFCESIAEMTNLYTERFVEKNKGHLSSRVKKRKKVTSSEMKLFLEFILYQGMIWKPTYEHYFTTNSIFSTPGVKNLMSYNKFRIIDRFLHFVGNEKLGEKYPLAAKIQSIWDYCHEKFQSIYTPRKYISNDESLPLWKGRLSWKQSILTKGARFGLKMYSVNEYESGYIYKSLLYPGKEMTKKLAGDYKYVATYNGSDARPSSYWSYTFY